MVIRDVCLIGQKMSPHTQQMLFSCARGLSWVSPELIGRTRSCDQAHFCLWYGLKTSVPLKRLGKWLFCVCVWLCVCLVGCEDNVRRVCVRAGPRRVSVCVCVCVFVSFCLSSLPQLL